MTNDNAAAIENAEQVIERFGGIRPMAKKVEVAVTTVQGWKKRNVIPGTRREQVLQAAKTHNVDLSDILQGTPAAASAPIHTPPVVSIGPANQNNTQNATQNNPQNEPSEIIGASRQEKEIIGDLDSRLAQTEKRAVKKSTWINVILIVLAVGSAVALLWPKGNNDARLTTLEGDVGALRTDVDAVKSEQSFLSTLIPKDLDQRIANLQQQAAETQEKIGAVIEKAGEISQDVLGRDAGTMDERITKLEQHMADAGAPGMMTALLERYQSMTQSMEGNTQLNQAVSELNALVSSMNTEDEANVGQALSSAREQSTTLSSTFEGVPPEDMKAAALLLGMTQFRQSLNRDNTPFEDDLQLLMKLVGDDDPALTESLQRLAPKAQEGVLTPSGLSSEFKTIAGDVVVASLKGEDVSIQEKARAHMNELFQVEKDGELISGTPTQATLVKAQKKLDEGDVAGAITEVQTLEGDAAIAAQPWLARAQETLSAEQLKGFLGDAMNAVTSRQSKLVTDPNSGFSILVPGQPMLPPNPYEQNPLPQP